MKTHQIGRQWLSVRWSRTRVLFPGPSILILLLLCLAASDGNAASGPFGCWSGDGNAQDRCGTHHGTLLNGTGYGPGKMGQAFSFDGMDDCISIGYLPELQGAQEITVAAWVLKSDWTPQPGCGVIVGKWHDGWAPEGDNTFSLFDGQFDGGRGIDYSQKGVFCVWFEDNSYAGAGGSQVIPTNQWTHVVGTWRSTDGYAAIYKNGVLDGQGVGGLGKRLKWHTNYQAMIGAEGGYCLWGPPCYHRGRIDQVAIYDRALSASEVSALYFFESATDFRVTYEPSSFTENSGNIGITVQRLTNLNQSATITLGVIGGTATPGVDFILTNNVLNFAAGVTNLSFPLTILDDALFEGSETILLGLTNSATGWFTQALITILDDDTGIELENTAYTANEDAGQAVVGVRRQDDSPDPATVQFTTVNGTAIAGQDYVATNGILTFAAGETQKEIVVRILDDTQREPTETFSMRLTNVVGGSRLGNLVQSMVTIPLNDLPWPYFEDFSGTVGEEWSLRQTELTPVGNRRFLGQFGNDTVGLTLNGLPPHRAVTVSLDLFVINTWDGNSPIGGPDLWDLSVLGGPTLLHTTFRIFPDETPATQAFPDNHPGGNHPARTGAVENNSLGYPVPHGDSVYHLVFTFPHMADTVTLNFSGAGLEDLGNESWGLDNVRVVLTPADGAAFVRSELPAVGSLLMTNQGGVQQVVTSGSRGLISVGPSQVALLELTNPASSRLLGTYVPLFEPSALELVGNLAYIACFEPYFLSTVEIVDFSKPATPVLRGYYDTAGNVQDLAVVGTLLYVADAEGGLVIVDASDPAHPRRIGGYDTQGRVEQVQVVGPYAYITDGGWLVVLDVSDPTYPVRVGLYQLPGGIQALRVKGQTAYVLEVTGQVRMLDLSDPGRVQLAGTYSSWGGQALAVGGGYGYLAKGAHGLEMADIRSPTNATWVLGVPIGGNAQEVAVMGNYVLVAAGEAGLRVLELHQSIYPPLRPPVVAGGMLTFTWPALEGVRLQKCTNLVARSWQDVPGSESTNTLSLPATEPTAFFRLAIGSAGAVFGTEVLLHFDEGNANSAIDSSGYLRDGYPIGVTVVAGRFGLARHFSGPGTYISVSGTEALDLASGMTIEAWVRFVEPNVDQPLVAKHEPYSGNGYFLGIGNPGVGGPSAGKPAFFVGSDPRFVGPVAINDGEWHHVAGVYDGHTQYLYVDGQPAGQQDSSYNTFNHQRITIGSYSLWQSNYGFNGDIDEVRVVNRPLSPAEIAASAGRP